MEESEGRKLFLLSVSEKDLGTGRRDRSPSRKERKKKKKERERERDFCACLPWAKWCITLSYILLTVRWTKTPFC